MYKLKDERMLGDVRKVGLYALKSIMGDKVLSKISGKIYEDKELFTHSLNVAEISTYLGIIYKFDLNELINLYTGAYLHDAGKLNLDRKILYKKGIFTDKERSYTETHTTIGYKLLKDTSLNESALEIVRSHHEKLDGSGYPDMLDNEEISIYTQIVTVADMFEAMTSDRCYRKAMEQEKVFNKLQNDKGINQTCVDILMNSVELNSNEHRDIFSISKRFNAISENYNLGGVAVV